MAMQTLGMTGLVFAPDVDFPTESDSREFSAEADHLVKLHGGVRIPFDNEDTNLGHRADIIEQVLAHMPIGSCDYVGFACHGWGNGIQAGFDRRGIKGAHMVDVLAAHIAVVGKPGIVLPVPLYCCSTAELHPLGFASALSLALASRGCPHRLFSHTTVGHATRNPFVREYPNGEWLIKPHSEHWDRWYRRLHDVHDDLRLRYPFMSKDDLIDELSR